MKPTTLFAFLLVLILSITPIAFADTIGYGSKGEEVKKIQLELKKEGHFKGTATGYYGSKTLKAVKLFQTKNGIKATGQADDETQSTLFKTAKTTVISRGTVDRRAADSNQAENTQGAAEADSLDENDDIEDSAQGEDSIEKPENITEYGELMDWWREADDVFYRGAEATVIDVWTGKSYQVKRTYGGNHADVETLTKEDTKIMKEIWGGAWSWSRRPVVVVIGDRKIAGSAAGMPHAGLDNKPTNAYVRGRSAGFGSGVNLDGVRGNGMDGHFDIHFLNSRTHGSNRVDSAHQRMVLKAAGR